MTPDAQCPLCGEDRVGPFCDVCGYRWPGDPPEPDQVMQKLEIGSSTQIPPAIPAEEPATGPLALFYRVGANAVVNHVHRLKFKLAAPAGPRSRVTVFAALDRVGVALRASREDLQKSVVLGPVACEREFGIDVVPLQPGTFGMRSMRIVVERLNDPGNDAHAYELADNSVEFTVIDLRAVAPTVTNIHVTAGGDSVGNTTTINARSDPAAMGSSTWTRVPLDGPTPVLEADPPAPARGAARPAPSPARSVAPAPDEPRSQGDLRKKDREELDREADQTSNFTTKMWVTAIDAVERNEIPSLFFGDAFLLRLYSDESAFCTLLSLGADGMCDLVMQDFAVPGRQTITLEGPSRKLVWKAAPPAGVQRFYAFFSSRPIALFGSGILPRPLIGGLPTSHWNDLFQRLGKFRKFRGSAGGAEARRCSSCRAQVDMRASP
ncbi:MAG TPA: hypothetical protein VG326_04275 [Tepidisphaeraceae bacterium]|jgi:hypothetical protein|nr:hypothetical protein [Tepidisphaeraceae bacterium]